MLSKSELAIERRIVRLVRDELAQQALYDGQTGNRADLAWHMAEDYLSSDDEGRYVDDESAVRILAAVIDDLFAFGPLMEVLYDSDVSDIELNAPDNIRVEVGGTM